MQMIYLDNAATTPLDPKVQARMNEVAEEYFANPSSIHSAGQKSKVLLEDSRRIIAENLGALASEIVFTSGGTEGNNLAVMGTARANAGRGKHVITSRIEHPSVLEPCQYLASSGFEISYFDVDQDGHLDLSQLASLVRDDTILISMMLVNNETGSILPVKKISELISDRSVILHCDAVQGLDKIDLSVSDLGVDLMTISAHKIYGPKGSGALYIRKGTRLANLLHGGKQEASRRAGTENLVGIAGFAEAIKQMRFHANTRLKITELRNLFETKLKETIEGIAINGENSLRVPHFSNIYFPFLSGDSLLMNLDVQNIAVSTGSACSSGSHKPSYVLRAMGYDNKRVQNSLRFSLGRQTSQKDITNTIDVIEEIYQRVSK